MTAAVKEPGCCTRFSMKKPEIDIENYEEEEKAHDVDAGDNSQGNEASE